MGGLSDHDAAVARLEGELGATVVGEQPLTGFNLDIVRPREPVPDGWLEGTFLPAVAVEGQWVVLDEIKHRLNALIGYLENEARDRAILQAAHRAIEIRRGELLGPMTQGQRTDLEPRYTDSEVDESAATIRKFRRMAKFRDLIWPKVIDGARKGNPKLTGQAYCMALIREHAPDRSDPDCAVDVVDVDTRAEEWRTTLKRITAEIREHGSGLDVRGIVKVWVENKKVWGALEIAHARALERERAPEAERERAARMRPARNEAGSRTTSPKGGDPSRR